MINVESLTKAFGPKVAVNELSFTVERGEVLGFLGPNGAGKSTTMRMITGFIPPTSGRVTVGGHDVVEELSRGGPGRRGSASRRSGERIRLCGRRGRRR